MGRSHGKNMCVLCYVPDIDYTDRQKPTLPTCFLCKSHTCERPFSVWAILRHMHLFLI